MIVDSSGCCSWSPLKKVSVIFPHWGEKDLFEKQILLSGCGRVTSSEVRQMNGQSCSDGRTSILMWMEGNHHDNR
jgi:hypothetical protein